MRELSFSDLREANRKRAEEYPSKVKMGTTFFGLALAGEVGELANFIKKEARDGVCKKAEIEKEIADILIYLDLLANQYNINLSDVTISKFNEVSDRIGSSIQL